MAGNADFSISLVMAGAVSAGAYSAGVIDFLILALDEWEAAKNEPQTDTETENAEESTAVGVPDHSVEVLGLTGASAGSIVAALTATALNDRTYRPGSDDATANPFYRTWVDDADIKTLLTLGDIKKDAPIRSILNSDAITDIAKGAVRFRSGAAARPQFPEELRINILTTNLRGVPYAVPFTSSGAAPGNDENEIAHAMTNHSDHVTFQLKDSPNQSHGVDFLWLDRRKPDHPNWNILGECALASSAFPGAFAARYLERRAGDYANRRWQITDPGAARCYTFDRLPPNWNYGDPDTYGFANFDAGVLNNEPFNIGRRLLLASDDDRNPREPDKADRAVVMIDPFPNRVEFENDYRGEIDLVGNLKELFGAVKAQASFRMEDIKLAASPDIHSRYMIAPRRRRIDNPSIFEDKPLASSSLGHFGGFLSDRFRRHDFLLGRKNCQAFLRKHFVVRKDHQLVRDHWSAEQVEAFKSPVRDDYVPIIPLVGKADQEAGLPEWQTVSRDEVKTISELVDKRVNEVAKRMISDAPVHGVLKGAGRLAWKFRYKGKTMKRIREMLESDLKKHKLVRD